MYTFITLDYEIKIEEKKYSIAYSWYTMSYIQIEYSTFNKRKLGSMKKTSLTHHQGKGTSIVVKTLTIVYPHSFPALDINMTMAQCCRLKVSVS